MAYGGYQKTNVGRGHQYVKVKSIDDVYLRATDDVTAIQSMEFSFNLTENQFSPPSIIRGSDVSHFQRQLWSKQKKA